MIATFVDSVYKNWHRNLHAFRHAINTATQATTKVSPAFLNFGRQPKSVKNLRREVEAKEGVVSIDLAKWQDRLKRLNALRDLVAKHINIEQERQKKYLRHLERFRNFINKIWMYIRLRKLMI